MSRRPVTLALALAAAAPVSLSAAAPADTAPRPLALSDATREALEKEIARRGLSAAAIAPLIDALGSVDPWVALVREASVPPGIESASALAYLVLDRAAAERGVPAAQRMALADPADATEQLEELAAQMRVIEDAEPSIPEVWRAALAQLTVDLARARRLVARALAPIGPVERRAASLSDDALAATAGPAPDPALLHLGGATALLATDAFLALIPAGSPPSFAWRTDLPGVTGPALGPFATAAGPLFLGGVARNEWSLPADAIVVDLGGDDLYRVTAPVRIPDTGALCSVIVDLDGRDEYLATRPGALGGALFGLSLLRDERGDDRYEGASVTLGAAMFGVGLLVDGAGDDRYSAERLSQGAAAAGFGILADAGGDDAFLAGDASQGFGGAGGVGVLVDALGDDLYRGRLAQGVATGSGASGVLLDAGGSDVYLSDASGQADAARGRGLLVDGGGADLYRAGALRGQAEARDGGVALLVDLGAGADIRVGRAQAFAYGGTAILLDDGGENVVRCGDASACRGAAAAGGSALFLDIGSSPAVRIAVPTAPGRGR